MQQKKSSRTELEGEDNLVETKNPDISVEVSFEVR
jgi:hypothetical protein